MRKIHESINNARICDAVEEHWYGTEKPGFCLACGADCKPDGRTHTVWEGVMTPICNFECPECGAAEVYGAEEVLSIPDGYHLSDEIGPFSYDLWRLKRIAVQREGSYCYQTQLNHTDNR
tara:strand:- start:155 stop:514 length:360 start_codon:yes stop_codon:yes gene_type:complete